MQSYTHFTLEERGSLQLFLKEGYSQREIARKLGRNPTSISREINRNRNKDGTYTPLGATYKYLHRRKRCRRKYRLEEEVLQEWVRTCLEKYWPPEAIVAKWKEAHGGKLSAGTIYNGIKNGMLAGCSAKKHLARRGKRKYKRGLTASIQPERVIGERSEAANRRTRIGDWEGDTIYGARYKGFIVTCVDRKSRYMLAAKAESLNAEHIGKVMIELMSQVKVKTLTLDNGAEFAGFREIEKSLGAKIYFTNPRSPWERGTNENSNGKLRFFFPKGTEFTKVTQSDLEDAVELLNTRPRKCLGWLSPKEVFFSKCCT